MEKDDTIELLVQNFPLEQFDITDDENFDALIDALATVIHETDDRIRDLNSGVRSDEATGTQLDELAASFEMRRKVGESDEALRSRLRAEFPRAASDTTIAEYGTLTQLLLDAEADQFVLLAAPDRTDARELLIEVDQIIVEEAPVSDTLLAEQLESALPLSATVRIETFGSFELTGPNHDPAPNSGLNEGTLGGTI